jgi:hypothetical protein
MGHSPDSSTRYKGDKLKVSVFYLALLESLSASVSFGIIHSTTSPVSLSGSKDSGSFIEQLVRFYFRVERLSSNGRGVGWLVRINSQPTSSSISWSYVGLT